MSDEIVVLDLDWDFIQHLVIPESFNELRKEQFSADLIEDELAEDVWTWQVNHYREHGVPATASVIEDEFDEVTIEEPLSAIGDLIERLRLRYVRNKGREKVESLANTVGHDPLALGKTMVAEGRHILEITEPRGDSFGIEDHDRAVEVYDKMVTQGFGPSFGYEEIDKHTHGQKGVSVLLAPPKTYKSWQAVGAVNAQINQGGFPYLYSLELPAEDTYWRLICLASDIPYWKYLHGSLTSDDERLINYKVDQMKDLGLFRIDKPPPGERGAHQLVEKAMNADAECILIDQLQYVEAENGQSLGALNKTGYYFEVMNAFRDYSDEIPIFIVHQFNRTVMGVDGMPEMQQAKGSSAIEEVATIALATWATKDMRASNLVNIGVNFSRHYTAASWEVQVELTKGCSFNLLGEVDE